MPLTLLASVADKTGIVDLVRALAAANGGLTVLSTGGTYAALEKAAVDGVTLRKVADVTGFPEILGGRVKTLHPRVFGGLLATDSAEHSTELAEHEIGRIDAVAVNLYPFAATIARPDCTQSDAVENIDIGGVCLLRAAAKNHAHVAVLCNPGDYAAAAEKLVGGSLDAAARRQLARQAFAHTAQYDALIAEYLLRDDTAAARDKFPEAVSLPLSLVQGLKYGENPHQAGAVYRDAMPGGVTGIVDAEHLAGPPMGLNNYLDADAALRTVREFHGRTACVVIKHLQPCGCAVVDGTSDADQAECFKRALSGDPVSAYGGIVAFNRPVSVAAAEAMRGTFFEICVAPSYADGVLGADGVFAKRKKLRVLRLPERGFEPSPVDDVRDVRRISGGMLVQQLDATLPATAGDDWRVVTERKPTDEEMRALRFAWRCAKNVKSNAIVMARGEALTGIGCGQPNRVQAVHLAARVSGEEECKKGGLVLASDAFFPFPDNIELAASNGVVAIVQPGGSIRDEQVIKACNELKVAMVVTGKRHFAH